jgi:hypothetical protein
VAQLLSLAKKIGMSVLCGHTHKMGITFINQSFNGKLTSSLYGFEVGNMMDLKTSNLPQRRKCELAIWFWNPLYSRR